MSDQEYFTQIPDWLIVRPDVSQGAKLTYGRLLGYARNGQGVAWPSMATLGQSVGVGPRQAYDYVQELAGKGLLIVEQRKGTSSRFAFPSLTDAMKAALPSLKIARNLGTIVPKSDLGTIVPTTSEQECRPPSEQECRPPRNDRSEKKNSDQINGIDQRAREQRAPVGINPEVVTIQETAARLWSRGKRRPLELNAEQVRRVRDLMDAYQAAGRPREDVLSVMAECAGQGWQWSTFLTVTREELDGTRRKPAPSGQHGAMTSAPRNRGAAMDQLRRSQQADWSPEADAWAADRDWVSLRPLADFSPEELALARVAG